MSAEPTYTRMFAEAAEAAATVQRQLERNDAELARIGAQLRRLNPPFVVTVARGSSDHATTYAKYLLETRTGLVTASLAPSVVSVYNTPLRLAGSLCLLVSQSGASPDLLAVAEAARKAGAFVLALVNAQGSPLAQRADAVLELQAGPETSVAATKSFIGSLSAVVHLVSHWQQDRELAEALAAAPDQLRSAWDSDWSAAMPLLADAPGLFVLGRGLGLGIASEAALKFKEVCGLHAEAFSSAEVLHGPVTIARGDFPVLALAQNDASLPGMQELVKLLAGRKVRLATAGLQHPTAINLPAVSGHPVIEPLLRIQSFYRLANALSVHLGRDPDHPPHLNKVTATV
jgi:glucosamine--fructose-6-phosphate aminotransferase (isomerizing)